MPSPLPAIAGVLAVGAAYVATPLVLEAHRKWRGSRRVTCPHKLAAADVKVKTWRAALTSLVRNPSLQVRDCTFWPECRDCDQACRASL
jgi:hypothetical protein